MRQAALCVSRRMVLTASPLDAAAGDCCRAQVAIGVIDEGIALTNPELTNAVWVNPYDTTADALDNDGNGASCARCAAPRRRRTRVFLCALRLACGCGGGVLEAPVRLQQPRSSVLFLLPSAGKINDM